jgi:hypothetical protein
MAKFSTRDIVVTVSSQSKTYILKDLHIKVETIKTISASPNIANITIYNLSQNSLAFLTEIYNDDKFSLYSVNVVVDDNLVYTGDLVNVRSIYKLGTWETNIYANEGYNALRKTAKVETKEGDTRATIVDLLSQSLEGTGLNAFDFQAIKNGCGDKSILKRLLYDGNVLENIKKLIQDCTPKSDLFIEDGKLNALPRNIALERNTEVTSFLEPPQLNEAGCRATMLARYDIKIGTSITLKAKSYNQSFGNLSTNRTTKSRFLGEGVYKVIEVVNEVDNFTEAVAKTHVTGIYLR